MSHLETEFPRPKAEEYHIQLHPGDMPKGVLLSGLTWYSTCWRREPV